MRINKLFIAMMAISVSITGCKTDDESDLLPPPSTTTGLYINEVYSSNPDWVELYNSTDKEIDLSNFILQDDKGAAEEFKIPAGTKIAPKSYLILDAFSFGLSSSNGDELKLFDSKNGLVDEIKIPVMESGKSYGRTTDGASNWKKFDLPTKGKDNTSGEALAPYIGKIVINEVYTFSDQSSIEDLDWIELYNTTDSEISLGGLLLWESGGSEEAWTIPANTKIAAKSRLLIECDKYNLHNDPVNYPAWGLSKGPDEHIVLATPDFLEIDRIACPSLNRNESYGRKTDGAAQWQIFVQYTKGTPNTGEARPEHINTTGLYINEVYHDNSALTDLVNPDWDPSVDFIELYNSTNAAIDISGWEIYDDTDDDSKKYVIPSGTIVPAKGYKVYDVFKENTNGPTFGLGVGGDWVYIYKPGKSELIDVMEIPGFGKESGLRGKGYTYGRLTDGSANLTIFKQASKGKSNNNKEILPQE